MNNRRDFLKKTGMMTMTAMIPTFATGMTHDNDKTRSLKKNKISVNDGWDVIVVGGGPGVL
ncbi:hypothetical protein FACS1894174_01150 [Bacteroidia bacterium]|nr:hypothetical protein FACS1894203_2700 [Bacteroidia bacterium]GHV20053.1 hypothetical protein FACS1894174_01150 [Bacteroidia bacterium]